ncbi:hypothetical protein [Streptomyces omiyaensis]|uniref:Uncharacterized protein n=1 Tax=Streptomyces omiyaensis TaxID=68247 RepID=A0ABW7BJM1_9ACTN|nr:hypothetical protein [Streptomyces omiyaensis]GGY31529.1 hypothetical protein GCM10010363_10580 [Streptomyces omiyaensis]
MTQISKGEDLPVPGQPGQGGPVPLEIPHGAVGKSAGAGAGTGSGTGPGADAGTGFGTGTGTSSAADGSPAGSGPPGEDGAPPPRRVDRAAGGWWADLIAASSTPSPAPASDPSAAPSTGRAAPAGILDGGGFDDLVYVGRGDARFAMEEVPPPGYVLVEYAWRGTGFFMLDSVDWNGRDAVGLGGSHPAGRFAQRVMWCDDLYPLRFRLRCGDHDEWVIVVRPVTGVRELGAGATGRGTEVLLHTGPAGELRTRLRPAGADASLRVLGHKPRRPGAPAPFPDTLASDHARRPEDARKLPEGPLLVEVVNADGEWSFEVGPVRPPEERKPGFWGRLFGR